MMLEEHDPNAVPPGFDAETLVLAARAWFLQGKLKALDGIGADVKGSLRLVDNLHLMSRGATAVDVDFRCFHVGFFEDIRLRLHHVSTSDVTKIGLFF